MKASFLADPGGEGFGLTRPATRNNDPSSFGIIRGGGGGGGGAEKKRVLPLLRLSFFPVELAVELGVVVVLTVKTTASGRQRRRAQKRESGVGDSIVSVHLLREREREK